MNISVICSALNNSYFGLEYKGKTVTETIKSDEKNYHSLYLLPKIKETIKNFNVDLKKLDAIAVNTGTGSFTGIRVAMTVSKVVASELNLPLIPLNTTEILLRAFEGDILITDARRDMYFFGTKEKTELVYKDKLNNINPKNKIITDERCYDFFNNAICYETQDRDLAKVMLEIAKEKFENEPDKSKFNPLLIEANYIQTPPVF